MAVVGPRIWGCERAHAHTPKSGHLYGRSQRPILDIGYIKTKLKWTLVHPTVACPSFQTDSK